jgi:hypothetical protein
VPSFTRSATPRKPRGGAVPVIAGTASTGAMSMRASRSRLSAVQACSADSAMGRLERVGASRVQNCP